MIGELVTVELALDRTSKEVITLTPGEVGTFDEFRTNYTWNALIPRAVAWAGLD